MGRRNRALWPAAAVAAGVVTLLLGGAVARAGTTITSGTCDQSHLQAALDTGGAVTFSDDCTIDLSSALHLTTGVTIDGSGHTVVLDGQNSVKILQDNGSGSPSYSLVDLTLRNGSSTTGGAIFLSATHTLTVNGCDFANNHSGAGGAIFSNQGSVTISDSTFENNTSTGSGGALYGGGFSISGTTFTDNSTPADGQAFGGAVYHIYLGASFTDDTFVGNSSQFGGAIADQEGASLITGSTFTGNSAASHGGAIELVQAQDTITNSTLVSNSSPAGSAVFNEVNEAFFASDTVANNTGGSALSGNNFLDIGYTIFSGNESDCDATHSSYVDNGFNLTDTDGSACRFSAGNNDTLGTAAHLADLGNYGGPTKTMALQATSPAAARDTGSDCGLSTDQRGVTRPSGQCSIGAVQYDAANQGIGTCNESTLDAAVSAGVSAGTSTIDFGCSGTITLTSTITVPSGAIITLDGEGNSVTIDGGWDGNGRGVRLFELDGSANLTLNGLTLTHGKAAAGSVAYSDDFGSQLLISSSTITDNHGFTAIIDDSGTATVVNSTVAGNTTEANASVWLSGGGAGYFSQDSIVDNVTHDEGSIETAFGPLNGATLVFADDLISGNANDEGVVTNCNNGGSASTVTDLGYNLADGGDDGGGCGFSSGNNDVLTDDPLILPLGNYGGPTETYALEPGSPARDAGTCTDTNGDDLTNDQRGDQRPVGSACDIGAYEATAAPETTLQLSPASPDGSDGWYVHAPQATLRVTDSNHGAAVTKHYGFGTCTPTETGGCTTYSSPFAVPDGDNQLSYFATDDSPAWETQQQAEIKVDDAAPTTQADTGSYTPGTWTASDVDVSLSATDSTGGSGVATTSYTPDGGAPTSYTTEFTVSGDGDHTLDLSSTDVAGNVESGNALHVRIAGNGEGAMPSPTTEVAASSTGNTITLSFTAVSVGLHDGAVSIDVPTGWSAPSTTPADPGYTSASAGTVGVSAQTVTVTGLDLAGGDTLTIVYGDTSDGGPGAAASGDLGDAVWAAQERSAGDGVLTALASSPSIDVVAADGSGTLATTADRFSASSVGHTVTFTYTAAPGGTSGGLVKLAVPDGWSAPSTTGTDDGYTTSSAGTVDVAGQAITVTGLDLAGGDTLSVVYGDTSGGGAGAVASAATGAQIWQAGEASVGGDASADLAASPSIDVIAADGSGTLDSATDAVSAGAAHRTLTFTYTAATGGMHEGKLQLTVPAGWSAPDVTGSSPGYTTASTGTVGVSAQTITVSGVTLAGGAALSIVYGGKGSGGPGATAPGVTGAQTWHATEGSLTADTPAGLGASPSILVAAADGSGTLHTPTTGVTATSPQRTITFTYRAAAGGLHDGTVGVTVPSGWSGPSTTGSAAGYTTASTGAVGVTGQTIAVSGVTLAGGATLSIVYGDRGGGGPGASAPGVTGTQAWSATERSSAGGTTTALAASPGIRVYSADGSGTLKTTTTTVSASSPHQTLTFTYIAALGGMNNGAVRLVVPAGWSAPSLTPGAAGYTTASPGTVGFSGKTITVSGVTLGAGQKLTIVYGSTAGGGPGASASASPGAAAWQASEASLAGDAAANVGTSPTVNVVASDGSGTLTASPTSVAIAATGKTVRFTYTAATGGLAGGKLTLSVPSGWSAPSTTSSAPGYATATPGTLTVSGRTITVSGLTRSSGQIVTIVYGSKAVSGPGATAPVTAASQTWTASESSVAADSPRALAASPAITVAAPDGSGTVLTLSYELSQPVSTPQRTLAFVYVAATGGVAGGSISVDVPSGWSPPSTNPTDPGYATAAIGTVSVSSRTIVVSGVTLSAGQQLEIDYGSQSGGGPGATSPATGGTQVWKMKESSATSMPTVALHTSPSIDVVAPDGSGTVALSPDAVAYGTTGQSLTFTYTTATGGMIFGLLTVAVPSGWPAPSTTRSNSGYATTSSGYIQVSGRTIMVTGLHRTPGQTVTIVYGSRTGGGPGLTIPNTNGPQTWTVQEASGESSRLTNLAALPQVGGVAPDGSGTATASIASVLHAATSRTITFHYVCASGGMFAGTVTLAVPTGWSAPSTSPASVGYTTATTGSVSVSGRTITVSGINCTAGQTIDVVYGSKAGGGHGATAPSTAVGNQTWTMQQQSRAAGTLTTLASSPVIRVT
jgi:predicted outer membrane repeat protein